MKAGVRRAQILAHRGLWSIPTEANSPVALKRALKAGFGIETDLRDLDGVIVVSHDPPIAGAPSFEALLREWADGELLDGRTLALNIKSDGLLPLLASPTQTLSGKPHFFFDMSFPQLLEYAGVGKPVALRISEYEEAPMATARRLGVSERYWLDGFDSDWWLDDPVVDRICRRGQVAVVSPEIHHREPSHVWEWFAAMVAQGCDILICTDRPLDVLEACS